MGKFALNSDCFLVRGAKKGAIYNLSDGNVYSVDEDTARIIDRCEKGFLIAQLNDFRNEIVLECLNSLENLKLGRFLDKNQTISKMEISLPEKKLKFIWLELIQICNQKCVHCYANCPHEKEAQIQTLSLQQWQNVIAEAFSWGCKHLQLTGGEPMLFGKDIFKLIRFAKQLGYEIIEIFTNATLFDDEDMNLLTKYDVRVATNVYSQRKEVHESITKLKGSFEKTVTNIKKLRKKGVEVFLSTVLMKQNEQYTKETVQFMEELGELNPLKRFDIARPVGRNCGDGVLSDKLTRWSLKKKPIFPKISKEDFIKRKYGHSCWRGIMAITPDGSVIPCTMSRQEIYGNVKSQSLTEILESPLLNKLWSLSKDYIEVCKDCEYRYMCLDCRPLARKGGGDELCAKVKHCLYDPYQGEWLNERR